MSQTDDDFSFVGEGKESFKERLLRLIGNRSVRAAASDWGIPVSTLNNYIHKGTEPSFKIACLISNKEHVSLNWLAYGQDQDDVITSGSNCPSKLAENVSDNLAHELLRRAPSYDRERLINAICSIGIKGVLQRLEQPSSVEEVIRALNIRESSKDAICMVLAGDESTDREILRRIESRNHARAQGDNTSETPREDEALGKKQA